MNLDAAARAAVAIGLTAAPQTGSLGPWISITDPSAPTSMSLSMWPDGKSLVSVFAHDESASAMALRWEARIAPVLAAARDDGPADDVGGTPQHLGTMRSLPVTP